MKTGDNVLLIKKYSILETNGILGETQTANMPVGTLLGYRINHEINEINKKIAELQSLIRKGLMVLSFQMLFDTTEYN